MSIARYDLTEDCTTGKVDITPVPETMEGRYVSYKDYAALEARCAALASLEAEPVAYVDPFAFHNFSVYRAGETDNKRMGREWMWANPGAGLIPVYTSPPEPVTINAEPVAWLWSHRKHPSEVTLVRPEDDERAEGAHWSGWSCQALYAAPPATVSVPDERPSLNNGIVGFDEGWNACRAAMLQGAEPVTTAYKLPANTPCKDAPEHIWLQTAGIWPENGEFSELTWCSDNQHPDDTLYVRADVVTGNSPVIPNGWVLVPMEPTEEMCDVGHVGVDVLTGVTDGNEYYSIDGENAAKVYRAMIAAAPQQEVKP